METKNALSAPPDGIDIPTPPLSKWERDYEAFERLLPQLLATYRDKYVAVHDGKVVDSDQDDVALILRVHARHGYLPIHVGKVTDVPPPPIRVPYYRLYRPEEET